MKTKTKFIILLTIELVIFLATVFLTNTLVQRMVNLYGTSAKAALCSALTVFGVGAAVFTIMLILAKFIIKFAKRMKTEQE